MSSPVTASILDFLFSLFFLLLGGFEECCRLSGRRQVVDKRNFLSFSKCYFFFLQTPRHHTSCSGAVRLCAAFMRAVTLCLCASDSTSSPTGISVNPCLLTLRSPLLPHNTTHTSYPDKTHRFVSVNVCAPVIVN